MFCSSCEKLSVSFTIISSIAAATRITINKIRTNFLINFLIENCPCEFKLVIYKRYNDDTFLLFRSNDHIEKFWCYLNCQHPNIKFTSEIEKNTSVSFLNIKIRRVNNSLSTSIYRKLTFSGVFTNFESFIPVTYKSNLTFTLLFRAFKLYSNFKLFHQRYLRTFLKELVILITLLTFVSKDF